MIKSTRVFLMYDVEVPEPTNSLKKPSDKKLGKNESANATVARAQHHARKGKTASLISLVSISHHSHGVLKARLPFASCMLRVMQCRSITPRDLCGGESVQQLADSFCVPLSGDSGTEGPVEESIAYCEEKAAPTR